MVQLDASQQHSPHTADIGARCKLSRTFERAGNLSDATSILGRYWQGAGIKPNVDGLPLALAAEVLLRVGVLTGWLDGQFDGTNDHQTAESIINEALSLYSSLHLKQKIAEAEIELAECWRRKNEPARARGLLLAALDLIEDDDDLKGRAIVRLAGAETTSGNHAAALTLLDSSHGLFQSNVDPSLTGKFYSGLVAVLLALVESETEAEVLSAYLDRIFFECAGARMFFEQSGNKQGVAEMENNLGYAYFLKGICLEALEHLDLAHDTFIELEMRSMMAQVDDTRARVLLALDFAEEAEVYGASAVSVMEEGGEQWALPAALTTHGRALARLNRRDEAIAAFKRARAVAFEAGDEKGVRQAEEAEAECFPAVVLRPKVASIFEEWIAPDDSMEAAGILQDVIYYFRRTHVWRDGDVVVAEAGADNYICFIRHAEVGGAWLSYANEAYAPVWCARVKVRGVLRRKPRTGGSS